MKIGKVTINITEKARYIVTRMTVAEAMMRILIQIWLILVRTMK